MSCSACPCCPIVYILNGQLFQADAGRLRVSAIYTLSTLQWYLEYRLTGILGCLEYCSNLEYRPKTAGIQGTYSFTGIQGIGSQGLRVVA